MKKVMVVAAIGLGLFLSGCGKSPFESDSAMISNHQTMQYDTMIGCREWVSNRDALEISQYSDLTAGDKTFALMHRETMRMVAGTFGNGNQDPCAPGTSVWDAYIAYIKEVNETGRTAITTSGNVVTHALTVTGAVWAAGEIADAIGSGGDRTTTTVQGDYDYSHIGRDQYSGGEAVVSVGHSNEYPIISDDSVTTTSTLTEVVEVVD